MVFRGRCSNIKESCYYTGILVVSNTLLIVILLSQCAGDVLGGRRQFKAFGLMQEKVIMSFEI